MEKRLTLCRGPLHFPSLTPEPSLLAFGQLDHHLSGQAWLYLPVWPVPSGGAIGPSHAGGSGVMLCPWSPSAEREPRGGTAEGAKVRRQHVGWRAGGTGERGGPRPRKPRNDYVAHSGLSEGNLCHGVSFL